MMEAFRSPCLSPLDQQTFVNEAVSSSTLMVRNRIAAPPYPSKQTVHEPLNLASIEVVGAAMPDPSSFILVSRGIALTDGGASGW